MVPVTERRGLGAEVERDDGPLPALVREHAVGCVERRVRAGPEVRERVAQADEVARQREERLRVAALVLDVDRQVAERQPGLDAGLGEPGAGRARPLHRRARAVAAVHGEVADRHRVLQLLVLERRVDHPDLVALVEEHAAAQRHQHHQRAPGAPGSSSAHRVGKRGTSWLLPVHTRLQPSGMSASVRSITLPERRRLERRLHERDVEREVQLVAGAVERDDVVDRGQERLADEHPRRVVGVGDRAEPAMHVVHLGPALVVDGPLAAHLLQDRVVVGRRRVVAQLAVLDDHVRDVDAEPGDAAVEPEPQDPVELVADLLVPPVEVGLLGQEVLQVVLAGRSSSVHAEPPKLLTQLFGGEPSGFGSAQTYQSRFGLSRDERDSWNHGCSMLVWFGTRSSSTLMPRVAASAMSSSTSASVPSDGSTSQKSATS